MNRLAYEIGTYSRLSIEKLRLPVLLFRSMLFFFPVRRMPNMVYGQSGVTRQK